MRVAVQPHDGRAGSAAPFQVARSTAACARATELLKVYKTSNPTTIERRMDSQLAEAWRMSNECNLFLLGHLTEEYLEDRYDARTRTVAAQFAHMHSVRLRWLEHAAPELVGELQSFPRGAKPGKDALEKALVASEAAVATFLDRCEATGTVRQWDGSPATMLSYLVAHEAHHRALAMVAMRLSGHKLPKDVVYGQWQWGKKRSLR